MTHLYHHLPQRIQTGFDVERWPPIVVNEICADLTRLLLYIRMVDLGLKGYLRGLEGVVRRKREAYRKDAALRLANQAEEGLV